MRTLLLTAVFFLCSPTWAGWTLVTTSQGEEFYIDMDTLRIDKNLRRFWTLTNLSKRGDRGELSLRSLKEIDCKQERDRSLVVTGLSGAMGSGEVLGSYKNDDDPWDYIAPRTVMQVYLSKVCPK